MLGEYIAPKLVGGTSGTNDRVMIVNLFRGFQLPQERRSHWASLRSSSCCCFLLRRYIRIERCIIHCDRIGIRKDPRRFILSGYWAICFCTFRSFCWPLSRSMKSRAGNLPFTGITLDWYRDLFNDYLVIVAFKNSLFVAALYGAVGNIHRTSARSPW